jgi:hypothetical protein
MLLLGGIPLAPALDGRTSPPVSGLDEARRAVEEARRVGARDWAPEMLAEAEE